MANTNLANAKTAKNDEFYTQYPDIQKEINAYLDYNPDVFRGKTVLLPCDDPEWSNFTKFFAQNFELLGLKKLISTSFAPESKKFKEGYMPSLFETESPIFDIDKTRTHGKIFVLDHDANNSGRIDIEDLQWQYLEGEGDHAEEEIKEWFKTINIAGIPLNHQEELNAIFSGTFVTLCKAEFSNSGNANIQKWESYVKGPANRQQFLATALEWVSKGNVENYMSTHRRDENINEIKTYFNTVIEWVDSKFDDVYDEMQGLNWGELYERFHHLPLNHSELSAKVHELMHDDFVTNRRGVFEYVLGGCQDTKLLNVRLFDKPTMRKVYQSQTNKAKAELVSNCPYCAIGHDANRQRIWKLEEMDADHVTAWSKGGSTAIENCQMLCKTHNRAKGNR